MIRPSARFNWACIRRGGLGAGARPEVGRVAAEEAMDEITRYLEGSNMVFITAGMGERRSDRAVPVIAAPRTRGEVF